MGSDGRRWTMPGQVMLLRERAHGESICAATIRSAVPAKVVDAAQHTMLGNPVVAHEPKFANVSRTLGEDDHHQGDNADDQCHRRSYPEHSALSVKRSVSGRLTMPFGNVCRC